MALGDPEESWTTREVAQVGTSAYRRTTPRHLADSGATAIEGKAHAVYRATIVLAREHPRCGPVALHLRRVAFRVTQN